VESNEPRGGNPSSFNLIQITSSITSAELRTKKKKKRETKKKKDTNVTQPNTKTSLMDQPFISEIA
jgi:hypothetical protein